MADPSQQNEARSENQGRERYFHPSNRPYRGRGRGRDYRVENLERSFSELGIRERGRGRDYRVYNVERSLSELGGRDLDLRERGRGRDYRGDNVERALNELGVRDLREHLDRKHQNEQSRIGPPSDPSYNYLRDPLRESEDHAAKVHASPLLRSNSYRGRGRSRHEEDTFIQNPMNIKVELSTTTGRRSYSLNEGCKLADIKHIPDYEQSQRSGFIRGRGSRGRGRGRYFHDQPGEEQRIRSKSTERRRNFEVGSHNRSRSVEHKGRNRNSTNDPESNSKLVSETVDYRNNTLSNNYGYGPENQKTRGRSFDGENRGRGRGRGRRWGGRRGRGNQRQVKPDNDAQPIDSNVATEENWDNEDTLEKQNTDEPCDPEPEFEDARNNDEQTDLPESYVEDLSIVINASDESNSKKRTVRFNLNENEEKKDECIAQEKLTDQNNEVDNIQ